MPRPRFHFIDDYRALVRSLIAQYPLAEAMSRAVGGSYEAVAELEKQLLIHYGLASEHTIVDVGCGSGRLAKALVPILGRGAYLGTDVVPELLDYARTGCPAHWRFELVEDLRIPAPDNSADFACFFSVLTHLLPEESYWYLLEARRVVRPGGRIVFSFLEYADSWTIFEAMYSNIGAGIPNAPLNTFIGRDAITAWAQHLGLTVVDLRGAKESFIPLSKPIRDDDGVVREGEAAFGQSFCVLSNDKPVPVPAPARRTAWSALNPWGREKIVS